MEEFILYVSKCDSKEAAESFKTVSGNNDDPIQYNLYIDKQATFNSIALWSNPAWLNTDEKSFHTRVASEWVYYHRIWMAIHTNTVADVVGSVRCAIPCSKLATYGDYRYDLDIETTYDDLDEILHQNSKKDVDCEFDGSICSKYDSEDVKKSKMANMREKLLIKHPSSTDIRKLVNQIKSDNRIESISSRSELDQWLSNWRNFLKNVRIAVGESDPWTDTLLKVCCRFLTAAQNNKCLMHILEAEMPIMTDYRQMYTDPIQFIELLSLPQPYLEGCSDSDSTQIDTLWLQLSSSRVRKLWLGNTATGKIFPNATFSDTSMGATNFLRRKQIKSTEKSTCIEAAITEDEAKRLLGSLINFIDEFNWELEKKEIAPDTFNSVDDASAKTSMESRRERNRGLFTYSYKPFIVTPQKLENPRQILNHPKSIIPVPPPNWIIQPTNLYMPPPSFSLPSLTQSVTPAIFQPPLMPRQARIPMYYVPATHYVYRDSDYYNKLKQQLSLNNINMSAMTSKTQDVAFTLPSTSFQAPISPDHVFFIRSSNQQQIRNLLPKGKTSPRQNYFSFNYQQSMMSTKGHQIIRHIPLRMEKTNWVQNEYFYSKINKNKILQNVFHTRLTGETMPYEPLQLRYQKIEKHVHPFVKENTYHNYLIRRKLLNHSLNEKLTCVAKVWKDFPLPFAPKQSNNLGQERQAVSRRLEFENERIAAPERISVQSKNEKYQSNIIEPNSKILDCKNTSIYSTQKIISDNCRIYKTKYCQRGYVANLKLKLIKIAKMSTSIQRKDLNKEVRIRKTSLKFFSKLLLSKCKAMNVIPKSSQFKNCHLPYKRKNCIAPRHNVSISEQKRIFQDVSIDEQQTRCGDSSVRNIEQCLTDKNIVPVTVEYLNDVANYLLFEDDHNDKCSNAVKQKIDGWTYFKIAILAIIRRATLILSEKQSNDTKII